MLDVNESVLATERQYLEGRRGWSKAAMNFPKCPADAKKVLVMLLGDDFSVTAMKMTLKLQDGEGY